MNNSFYDTDLKRFSESFMRLVNHGFLQESGKWLSRGNEVRWYDMWMRNVVSTPAVESIIIAGKTLIDGELIDIVAVIPRDGNITTMTKGTFEALYL